MFGLLAIVLGLLGKRPWARNVWFRGMHLAMIGIVVVEALLGVPCPLTVWENALRRQAGQAGYPGDFIGYWAHQVLFYQAPPWVFTLIYCAFGATVLLTFLLAPPRWRRTASA